VTDADPAVPWRDLLAETTRRLEAGGLASPEREARHLIEEVAGYEGTDLVLALGEPATQRGVARLDQLVDRRIGGEPLQYVLGRWSFRTLDLFVDRRVLIPRPETEVVAGVAVEELRRRRREDGPGAARLRAVDLGTGSGAIALSIAVECDGVDVWATDRSADALAVARSNLAGIGRRATAVTLAEGPWFEALDPELAGSFAVVIANPPYVGADEVLPTDVADWEPGGALVAGPVGTEDLEHLVDRAGGWLAPGGLLVLELAPHQAGSIAERARAAGLVDVAVVADLTGRDRALVARRA
jgi:release factor glutamine methyltransferase